MTEMLQQFQLEYGHIVRPLLVGTLVAIVCGAVGSFIILRRMAFLADAIAHSMLAGVVAGYLLTKVFLGHDGHVGAMLLGAVIAGVITVGLVGLVTRFTRLKEDTAIGIMYTGIFALGAFVISLPGVGRWIQIDIYHYIVGSVLAVSDAELWLLAIVATLVLGTILMFYRALQLTSFDPVMAASIGIPVLAFEYLLTALTSLVVVSGVQVVGVILVVALIITPAATAYLLTDRLDRMIGISAAIGVLGFWLGFVLASWVGASPGASVVVVMTALFGATICLAPRYGLGVRWLSKWQAMSQEVLEDLLGSMMRSTPDGAPISQVVGLLPRPARLVRQAIDALIGQELLSRVGEQVFLTDKGRAEALKLVRAHRIWESYLEKTGTPQQELHPKAHVLEHVHDQATIDYLDDKLGHPIHDPHGSEIPAINLSTNQECLLSLLRAGDQARVNQILPPAQALGLIIGDVITVGPRTLNKNSWSIEVRDTQLELTHDQADAVKVILVK